MSARNVALDQRIRANSRRTPGGCWEWTLAIDSDGYGHISIEGRTTGAHRASHVAFIGPIPPGMTVDHTCFNPSCVNPRHLRLLTRPENARNKDPRKTPPWMVQWTRPRVLRRSRQVLPADAPVIDFEPTSAGAA